MIKLLKLQGDLPDHNSMLLQVPFYDVIMYYLYLTTLSICEQILQLCIGRFALEPYEGVVVIHVEGH